MSKFFRSTHSDSSSSDEEETSISDGAPDVNQISVVDSESTRDIGTALNGLHLHPQATDHRSILLHSLLEERCLNEAVRELRGNEQYRDHKRLIEHPAVKALAREKYLRMCELMAPLNLASPGFEQDTFISTRQRYRDGLDALSRLPTNSQKANVPIPLRRLLTDGDVSCASAIEARQQSLQLARVSSAPSSVLDPLTLGHPVLEPSRYLRDFDELGVLGKGGFGIVYHVRNRLDDLEYAVKKVPISQARIARIRARGQEELNELLRELRTRARLDHPNIVRYHTGWIEWSQAESIPSARELSGLNDIPSGMFPSSEGDAVPGAINSESMSRVVMQSDSSNIGFAFESSTSKDVVEVREPHENTS